MGDRQMLPERRARPAGPGALALGPRASGGRRSDTLAPAAEWHEPQPPAQLSGAPALRWPGLPFSETLWVGIGRSGHLLRQLTQVLGAGQKWASTCFSPGAGVLGGAERSAPFLFLRRARRRCGAR